MSAESTGSTRTPLFALGALVLAVLITVTAVRVTGVGAMHVPDAAAVEVREFRFEDRPDGSIVVLDASGAQLIDTVAPGSNGFLRGTMRGLARERKRVGVSPELPFRMIGRADGKLTLEDPGTGRRVDLGSFGPTNAAVFAQIMASHPTHAVDTTSRIDPAQHIDQAQPVDQAQHVENTQRAEAQTPVVQ